MAAGAVFVLYRLGASSMVVVGSAHRERVEVALAALGAAWRIVRIPIETGALEGAAG